MEIKDDNRYDIFRQMWRFPSLVSFAVCSGSEKCPNNASRVWSNFPNTVNQNPETLWREKEQGMFLSVLFPLGRLSHYIDFSFHSRYYGPNASCVFTEILLWGMKSIFNNHKWLLELILFSASDSVNLSNALGAVRPTRCHFSRISQTEVKKFHKHAVKMCCV